MKPSLRRSLAAVAQPSFESRASKLYRKHQKIILPVVLNPRDYLLLSLRELAHKLGTDPATAVRIVRGLGFSSYKEFRAYLQEVAIAFATSLEAMQTGAAGAGREDPVIQAFTQAQRNLARCRSGTSEDRVRALAKRMYAARRILIVGGDLAASLVLFLEHHLLILELPAVSATTSSRTLNLVRALGKQDLLIAFSYGQGLRMTVDAMLQAKSAGAHVVGITDTYVSPVARFASEYFLTGVDSQSFAASYVAPMAFLDGVLSVLAHSRSKRTIDLLKQVAQEERFGYRWYREENPERTKMRANED